MAARTVHRNRHAHTYYFLLMPSNVHAAEPPIEVITPPTPSEYLQNAERVNGWLAMIGFNAAVGAYLFTGQILPGVF